MPKRQDVEPASHVHYGAFLRSIPLCRRVGDYAHAAARVLYCIYKRLLPVCGGRCSAELRALLDSLNPISKNLLPSEIVPSPALASIDLSIAHLFLSSSVNIQSVISILQSHNLSHDIPYGPDRKLHFHVVIKFLLLALFDIYAFWRRKDILADADLIMYNDRVNSFRLCWVSLGWKPALWVHWVCAHSPYYIRQHRNLYVFSSLPTERRHQGFKLDLRHAFQGWKVASPIVAARFLRTVVENDALDLSMTALAGAKK